MGSSTKDIAILGGGVSALAAALELSDPRHGGAFNVTIYQIGWRLGGKCATGRDMDPLFNYRIKEHGPHIFFGFYDNAFAILREAYSQLPEKPGRAFTAIENALVPQSSLATIEQINGMWQPWVLTLPVMPGKPGDTPLSGRGLLKRLLNWMQTGARLLEIEPAPANLVSDGARRIDDAIKAVEGDVVLQALKDAQIWLHDIWPLIGMFSMNGRRICILIDLGIATAIGALEDGLLVPTRAAVAAANEVEYSAWLSSHGAQPETVGSAIVRALYDTVFAYPGGDVTEPPNVEAGSAFLVQRAMMGYHDFIFWKMGAGTGDVVAAPIFEVLRARGVKVKFFHRVDRLVPSADNRRIAEIHIGRQATTPTPDYDPLIQVQVGTKQLAAWPDRPRYELLDQGAALRAQGADLESHWTRWVDPVSELVLQEKDAGGNGQFDSIVVAMPPEALRLIAPTPAPATWSDMFEHIGSVQTCSLQLWLACPVANDKCTTLASPTLCGFDAVQLDTWFDASAVIAWEGWAGPAPAQLALLCGPMPTILEVPPRSDHGFPAAQQAQALALGEVFLAASGSLWPGLQSAGSFDTTQLFSPDSSVPALRLSQQYWVAAVNPSDRYVQTLVGTSKFRLTATGSGYDNLFFCGDWTDYGFNFGCFEGAVISGLQAANAITGDPRPILNDPFNWS